MIKKIAILAASAVLSFTLCACTQTDQQSQEQQAPDYADDEAMAIIADGFENRSVVLDEKSDDSNSEEIVANLKKAVQAEIDTDNQLKSRQFEDSKLQEDVLSYLNLLDDSLDILNNYGYLTTEYSQKWTEIYDKRTALLKTFVDNYGLTVNKENEETLSQMVANGAGVTEKTNRENAIKSLASSISWEWADQGYGIYGYSAVATNTTEYSLSNVSLTLYLYDANNIKTEASAHTSSWKAGETVQLQAYGTSSNSEPAARVETEITYYTAE